MNAATAPPPAGPFRAETSSEPLRLGAELGRGGEGAVYALADAPERVVKLYHVPPDARKEAKLRALVAGATPAVLRVAAWPLDVVRDGAGRVVGVVLPRLHERRDVHLLYSPRSRARSFPAADFRFIGHVAANVARAFAVLHAEGHVVGDVNHASVVVSPDGTVRLLDCDSFQVRAGREVFPCDVGVPLFTPPELQGQPFRGLVRTPNHDAFGLAVLLFQLLCLGRHPFAGRYRGTGEMPVERAIAEYRFVYGPAAARYQMAPPPGTLPLRALGAEVAGLFAAAFGPEGSVGGRPSAAAWVAALDRLGASLLGCARRGAHQFPPVDGPATACPWCELEARTGLRLFGQRAAGAADRVAVDQLWAAIAAVPPAPPLPPLPGDRPAPPPVPPVPASVVFWRRGRWAVSMLVVIAMAFVSALIGRGNITAISFGVTIAVVILSRLGLEKLAQPVDEATLNLARHHWEAALQLWRRHEREAGRWTERRDALARTRDELLALPQQRVQRLRELGRQHRDRQLHDFLAGQTLLDANLPGVGPAALATLRAFGLTTAADCSAGRLAQLPKLSPGLVDALAAWRQELERQFRPDPAAPFDPRTVADLDDELDQRQRDLLAALRRGPADLTQLTEKVEAERARLILVLEQAWVQWRYAEQLAEPW